MDGCPQLVARSFASRNQLAVSLSEVDTGSQLEWERHYLTTLGVANKRLYEFRIQTSETAYAKAEVRCQGGVMSLTASRTAGSTIYLES